MSRKIQLSHGQFALIDDEDFESVSRFRWRVNNYGYARTSVYLGSIGGKQKNGRMYLHCLIMRPPYPLQVDHRNHNTLDCRRGNMRNCTRSQNNQNQKKRTGTSSRFKGVYWHKARAKWEVHIRFNGKHIHLGTFDNEVEAGMAYDIAAKEHFNEFAYLNFP